MHIAITVQYYIMKNWSTSAYINYVLIFPLLQVSYNEVHRTVDLDLKCMAFLYFYGHDLFYPHKWALTMYIWIINVLIAVFHQDVYEGIACGSMWRSGQHHDTTWHKVSYLDVV